jgi:flagellin
MVAARVLNTQMGNMNRSLERLSTGLRINRASDDPAGLIASEILRGEKKGLEAGIANGQRALNVISTAEGGMVEVSNLLAELESLVTSVANESGQSADELDAKQMQIDSILGTISRISGSTEFNGMKLLNGNFDYNTTGVPASAISQVRIQSAKLGDNQSKNVTVEVYDSAQAGQLKFTGAATAGTITLQVTGIYGSDLFTFEAGTTIAQMVAAINQARDGIGVSATLSTGAMYFNSAGFGSDAFVSVQTLSGSFSVTGGSSGTAYGLDPKVRINGTEANARGLKVVSNTNGLSVTMMLDPAFAQRVLTKSFTITGGGATFSLAADVMTGREGIGIPSFSPGSLGDSQNGFLTSLSSGSTNCLSSKNFGTAQRIVKSAIRQAAWDRGRLGAFQKYTIESSIRSMQVALENTTAAESAIRDTDFALETANLMRSQIMVQAASTMLRQATAIQGRTLLALLGA